MMRFLSSRRGKSREEASTPPADEPNDSNSVHSMMSERSDAPAATPLEILADDAGSAASASDYSLPNCLSAVGIRSWGELHKVVTVTFFCFTANTILLRTRAVVSIRKSLARVASHLSACSFLSYATPNPNIAWPTPSSLARPHSAVGRNIGATMLLVGLGADSLPYVMVLVGAFVTIVMPLVASVSARYSSRMVLLGTTIIMIGVLAIFIVLFITGAADAWPRVVYPLFFVLEEVIDSLLMVLFWQIGMLCFTKEEATRLIGIVNMGAAVANLANGVTVAILIHFFDSFAILPAQIVLLLLQLIPNHICGRWTAGAVEGCSAAPAHNPAPDSSSGTARKDEEGWQASGAPLTPPPRGLCASCIDPAAWYMEPITQLIAIWQFVTVVLFSCIEFSYNSTLANFLDANGIAQVTANLASVASLGQTIVNLILTPFLLQHAGMWAALLVTPIAYVAGAALVMTKQSVATVFICRSMDFIFRYTVSDNTKQILYKSVPPHQLMDAR